MKRIIAMLLAIMMLLSLAACGNSEKPAENNPAETKAPAASNQEGEAEGYTGPTGEITFVAWGSDNEIACDLKACEAFMASHPGTVVNFEALNEDYGTAVETRVIGGQAPDVIYGHPATLLKWIQEGMLQPITDVYENNEELWNEDIFFTNLYESYYYDGEYWATPVGADTFVLFYNKTMLDEAGIPYPTKDTTWEELAEMAEALTKRDEEGAPITLGMDGLSWNWLNILYSMGGKVLDNMNEPTKVVFESPEALRMLNFIKDNYNNEGGFYANDNDWTYLAGGFSAGEIAFTISGVYDIVWMRDIEGFEWDMAPLPESMSKEGDTPVLYCGYAVAADSKNPELAKEFARFMTDYEAQMIMGELGLITSLRKDVAYSDEILNAPGSPENHALRVDNLPYAQNSQGQCLCWWEITYCIENYIYQVCEGQISPEDAMKAIQAECSALLEAELAG